MARLWTTRSAASRPPCTGHELAVSTKPRWEVVDDSVMTTVSQVTAFVYAKVFAAMPSSISMNCYASATRQRLNLEGSAILEISP